MTTAISDPNVIAFRDWLYAMPAGAAFSNDLLFFFHRGFTPEEINVVCAQMRQQGANVAPIVQGKRQ